MKLYSAFKHLFIPHEGNEYKPHFFRELSVAIMLFSSIFLLGFSAGSSFLIHKTVLGASVAASVLVDLTNDVRLAYNETPLIKNDKLEEAAKLKGEDMAKLEYFAHESPTGITPWYWFRKVGYTFLYAGENLAINFTESKDVEAAWMASPKHKENILNVKFSEIGISTVDGLYNNSPTTYVVQMFGTPARAATEKSLIATTIATTTVKAVEIKPKINGTSTLAVGDGKVEGEASSTPVTSSESNILPLFTSPTTSLVKNTDNVTEMTPTGNKPVERYSTWLGRLLFGGSRYVDMIYRIIIIVVAIALLTMVLVEIKKQHIKHILYGVILLLVLAIFVYINQTFIY